MSGYSKSSSTSAITTSDILNSTIGKLEKALDSSGENSSGFIYKGYFKKIEIIFKNSTFNYFIISASKYSSSGGTALYFGYITGNENDGIYGLVNQSGGSSITPSDKKNNLLF